MGSEEKRRAAHSIRREAEQGVRCWGCGVVGHCLWACPNKVACPKKGEAQQKEARRVEAKEEVRRK